MSTNQSSTNRNIENKFNKIIYHINVIAHFRNSEIILMNLIELKKNF